MADYLTLGTTPPNEPCAQVGEADYGYKARTEGNRWIKQLKAKFGEPPEGARFGIKGFPHDFGTYYEVCIFYSGREAMEYALNVESNLPGEWEDLQPDTL